MPDTPIGLPARRVRLTYRQDVGDSASLTALVVVGLWIAYLVPHKLRHRQQLLESRTDDRFSESLRVLAVTSGSPSPRSTVLHEVGAARRVELLTPGRGVPAGHKGAEAPRGAGAVERPHATGDRISADAARRAAQQRAAHAAAVARRGAAARRRALLTSVLLVASVAGWVVASVTTLSLLLAVVPTVLLGTVLVTGRRAVVAGQAADAAYERRRRESAERASGTVVSGPRRTPAVVGRAVHPSDSHTEVIERITAEIATESRAAAGDRATADARAASATAGATGSTASEADDTQDEWAPVPVPRPTYTMKASAPRREPMPLSDLDFAPVEPARAAEATPTGASGEGDTTTVLAPAPGTASGGIDLDAVLARRRAAGE